MYFEKIFTKKDAEEIMVIKNNRNKNNIISARRDPKEQPVNVPHVLTVRTIYNIKLIIIFYHDDYCYCSYSLVFIYTTVFHLECRLHVSVLQTKNMLNQRETTQKQHFNRKGN